ncbi:YALIA101S10e03422g1_1 [Yarrowia lipolytica]|jgi:hypothetical protein|uniref:Uncharacterized protein n=1 Tax=Yarrowia lipolytica TaxID=4952 RepID=A0A1H6Q9F3_YARLL|nr:hypothetical protein YALI1_A03900g [Yarrowia lipolytica]QNP95068.1 Hypothetical protein YALI2_A00067g [Yarrowia lipolytica]SEI36209.1 YALIA101S10e03422g1_1 [Yarrowia lipolytica]VBB88828.1 Hypothetical protein conserved in the Yarrowia clade [Yarrowia lipolytica]
MPSVQSPLESLKLGKPRPEYANVESQLEALQKEPPTARSTPNYLNVNFYKLGIALCFFNGALDSVEYFNKPSGKFSQCAPGLYPSWFPDPNDSGKDLVIKFGEPLQKGGGTKKEAIDIWLRWKNFQVEMPTKNWDEAKDVVWCQLVVFQE